MYRVQNDQDYAPENQDLSNIEGAMFYLHNEIVNNHGFRRFGKSRVQRFLVKTQATQPLYDAGLNFGSRLAFDSGNCTGPFDCGKQFEKYGYYVGCNNVGSWPNQQWAEVNRYEGSVWYSFPGKCADRAWNQHDPQCEARWPGGACSEPTGQGNCTYSYELFGDVSIDEFEGIDDFGEFVRAGGWEYNNGTDRGVHMDLWDDKHNETACEIRVQRMKELFATKYPEQLTDDEVVAPICDFDYGLFYGRGQWKF